MPALPLAARAAAELERRRRKAVKAAVKAAGQADIGNMSFIEWAEDLSRRGLKVDGNAFTLDDRPAMRRLYELIPSTWEEAKGQILSVMKGAQIGATVWEMLAIIYMQLKWGRCWVGSFVPDRTLAAVKSDKRFMPILRGVPDAYDLLVTDTSGPDGNERNRGEGNVLTRQIGDNMLFFLWTSGKVSTESNPMDVISFDEVQEMMVADIQKTQERISGSRIKFCLLLSTAKWPDADIDWFFRRGTKERFHHRCNCPGGPAGWVVLTEHIFPDRIDCVGWDESVHEYRYRCPVCNTFIADNQDGAWVADAPGATGGVSVHYPQTLSVTVTPGEFLNKFNNAQDKQDWFNRAAGLPFSDPNQIPITDEVLNRCAEAGRVAGVRWETAAVGGGYYMGIDQMGAYNCVIVRKRLADGRAATVWVEEVRTDDPFGRCDVLMDLFGIAVCVVETLPNFNDAQRFAARYPGRVFLANYGDLGEDIMRWGDEPRTAASDKRTDVSARTRYTVTMDQYKAMQIAMRRMVDVAHVFPDPGGLVADSIVDGTLKPVAVLREVVWRHFKRVALVVEDDPETRKKRRKVVKVGIDPHFAYANMLCDVAWSRSYGTGQMWFAGAAPEAATPLDALRAKLAAVTPEGSCGTCSAYRDGLCVERGLTVGERDPGCGMWVGVD